MTREREAYEEADGEGPRRVYTKQDVIYQALIAFGQGTNFMRVSSLASREVARMMHVAANENGLDEDWGEIAVQVLERVRAVGRVAQAWAVEDGDTVIRDEVISRAFRKVGLVSKTHRCPGAGAGNQNESGGG